MSQTLKKTIKEPQSSFYVRHLRIINGLLTNAMTPREIEILAGFISLKGDLVNKDRFNSFARKTVRDSLGIDKPQTITNFLRSMVGKGYILKSDDGIYTILPSLFPMDEKVQQYNFTLIQDDKE